jgi:hypothetical protein
MNRSAIGENTGIVVAWAARSSKDSRHPCGKDLRERTMPHPGGYLYSPRFGDIKMISKDLGIAEA